MHLFHQHFLELKSMIRTTDSAQHSAVLYVTLIRQFRTLLHTITAFNNSQIPSHFKNCNTPHHSRPQQSALHHWKGHHTTLHHTTPHPSKVHHSTPLHSTVHHITAQYTTPQYTTVHHCIAHLIRYTTALHSSPDHSTPLHTTAHHTTPLHSTVGQDEHITSYPVL
jgi:hypothetical protein